VERHQQGTPQGSSTDSLTDCVCTGATAGKSGVTAIEKWDTEEMSTKFAGEIKELDCTGYVTAKMERRLDPYIKYTMVAAKKALEYSGLGAWRRRPSLSR